MQDGLHHSTHSSPQHTTPHDTRRTTHHTTHTLQHTTHTRQHTFAPPPRGGPSLPDKASPSHNKPLKMGTRPCMQHITPPHSLCCCVHGSHQQPCLKGMHARSKCMHAGWRCMHSVHMQTVQPAQQQCGGTQGRSTSKRCLEPLGTSRLPLAVCVCYAAPKNQHCMRTASAIRQGWMVSPPLPSSKHLPKNHNSVRVTV